MGEDFGKGQRARAVGGGKDYRSVGKDEFRQHLAASAAGRAGGIVEVGDGDCFDSDTGSELGNRGDQGGALSADRQAVADVFHVGSRDDDAVGELEGGTDAEAGVGRVGVERGLASPFEKTFEVVVGRDWVWVEHEV